MAETLAGSIAASIRAAAQQSGEVREEDVNWYGFPNQAVRKAIVQSLQDDLYIDVQERTAIVSKAGDEIQIVGTLLQELTEQQPFVDRLRYVQHLLDKQTCRWRIAEWWSDCVSQATRSALLREKGGPLRFAQQHAMAEARTVNTLDATPQIKAANR